MTETLRLFVYSDGPDSQQVDAAHGLEPPPPPPPPEPDYDSLAVWILEIETSSRRSEYWSFDLQLLRDICKRLNLQETGSKLDGVHVTIRRLNHEKRMQSDEWVLHQEPSPRLFHVGCLHLSRDFESCFTRNGYWHLGQIADMSWLDCKRIGVRPEGCRQLQKLLAKHGLSMSFETFPGEQYGWSPKRRSA